MMVKLMKEIRKYLDENIYLGSNRTSWIICPERTSWLSIDRITENLMLIILIFISYMNRKGIDTLNQQRCHRLEHVQGLWKFRNSPSPQWGFYRWDLVIYHQHIIWRYHITHHVHRQHQPRALSQQVTRLAMFFEANNVSLWWDPHVLAKLKLSPSFYMRSFRADTVLQLRSFIGANTIYLTKVHWHLTFWTHPELSRFLQCESFQ